MDPETGEVTTEDYEYEVEVPYEYFICTVTLENFDLSHLPVYLLTEDQLGLYAGYMATFGNRRTCSPRANTPVWRDGSPLPTTTSRRKPWRMNSSPP